MPDQPVAANRESRIETILDHYANPRHRGALADPECALGGTSPGCTDRLSLYLRRDDAGRIAQISFDGTGCAVSQAAASVLCEALTGAAGSTAAVLAQAALESTLGARTVETRRPCATLALRLFGEMTK